MKAENMHVVSNKKIALDTFELKLKGELVKEMTQPGQFLHLKIGSGWEHLLRRPISIADVNQGEQIVTMLYKRVGKGTDYLSQLHEGAFVDVLGPRGNGFPIEGITNQKIVLIGGGIGVPPLYYLGKKLLEQNNQLRFILGFQNKESVFYEQAFAKLGDYTITTDNGTYGTKGYVTDLLPSSVTGYDRYFSCGPTGMLKAITSKLPAMQGHISLEERMGCGIGACFACVCKPQNEADEKGYLKICTDGPVFEADEVIL